MTRHPCFLGTVPISGGLSLLEVSGQGQFLGTGTICGIVPVLKVSLHRFFVNFAVVSSINECSGAPVSGCSSLEEWAGKNEKFSALTHEYS